MNPAVNHRQEAFAAPEGYFPACVNTNIQHAPVNPVLSSAQSAQEIVNQTPSQTNPQQPFANQALLTAQPAQGASFQAPITRNIHQAPFNQILPAVQLPQTRNPATANALIGATASTRDADWYKPKNNIPCTWEGCTHMVNCDHNLKQHIREKHTRERPNVCDICQADFARPGTLYRHIRIVHKIEPNVTNKRRPRKILHRNGPVNAAPYQQLNGPPDAAQQPRPVHIAETMPINLLLQPAAPANYSCQWCGTALTGPEHELLHLHLEHGVPPSADECGCSFCKHQLAQPQHQFATTGVAPFGPQQSFSQIPVLEPQPHRPFLPSQLEQPGNAVPEAQLNVAAGQQQPWSNTGYQPPVDPAPTPGPDGPEQEMPAPDFGANSFDFMDYSQFADFGDVNGFNGASTTGFGDLVTNLDDLFPDLQNASKPDDGFGF